MGDPTAARRLDQISVEDGMVAINRGIASKANITTDDAPGLGGSGVEIPRVSFC